MKKRTITNTVNGIANPIEDNSRATIVTTDDKGNVVNLERVVNIGSSARPVYASLTKEPRSSIDDWKPPIKPCRLA